MAIVESHFICGSKFIFCFINNIGLVTMLQTFISHSAFFIVHISHNIFDLVSRAFDLVFHIVCYRVINWYNSMEPEYFVLELSVVGFIAI